MIDLQHALDHANAGECPICDAYNLGHTRGWFKALEKAYPKAEHEDDGERLLLQIARIAKSQRDYPPEDLSKLSPMELAIAGEADLMLETLRRNQERMAPPNLD